MSPVEAEAVRDWLSRLPLNRRPALVRLVFDELVSNELPNGETFCHPVLMASRFPHCGGRQGFRACWLLEHRKVVRFTRRVPCAATGAVLFGWLTPEALFGGERSGPPVPRSDLSYDLFSGYPEPRFLFP